MKVQYVVVYECYEENYGGYVPDLPGLISTGADLEDMRRMMREGIAVHIEALMDDEDPVPPATSSVADAMVAAADPREGAFAAEPTPTVRCECMAARLTRVDSRRSQ